MCSTCTVPAIMFKNNIKNQINVFIVYNTTNIVKSNRRFSPYAQYSLNMKSMQIVINIINLFYINVNSH